MSRKIDMRDHITIDFIGNMKFKQLLVNKIYEVLNSEEIFEEVAKPGCGFTFNSTLEPAEDDE